MKKILFVLAISIAMVSCKKEQTPQEKKELMLGYWVIEKVIFPDGKEADFPFSTSVEAIAINGGLGLRSKVSPMLDKTFANIGTSGKFTPVIKDNTLMLEYSSIIKGGNWKEEVISATDTHLELKNEEGKTYIYKRFEWVDFDDENIGQDNELLHEGHNH